MWLDPNRISTTFYFLMNTFGSLFLFATIIMTIETLILACIRYIVVETIGREADRNARLADRMALARAPTIHDLRRKQSIDCCC